MLLYREELEGEREVHLDADDAIDSSNHVMDNGSATKHSEQQPL